mmetsp:Transcript_8879/g.9851  ORF Transcript_8879/g.9851 Transcript_8879/m.9851 type:complete len:140 (-) Transcript_8879:70-489(-)
MSFEVLAALHNATLCQTEMEITYAGSSNITDYSVFTEGNVFGVSVTRAMKFGAGKFTSNDAFVLLKKKLKGVVESTKNVVGNKTWKKQILHVWAEEDYIAETLFKVWKCMKVKEKSNTLVYVTVSKNAKWIFYEPWKVE